MIAGPGKVDRKGENIMPSTPSQAVEAIESETMRRVSRRLVPLLMVCYFAAYLDRVNVGFAALTMNKALGMSAEIFGIGSGIFFLGYFLFEVPSNLILEKVGARRWIARILITWGIISAATAFVTGTWSFLAVRFLLGLGEAGFYPDPFENSGTAPPLLGDRYWYPLYEKLCDLDVPAHIHSAGSRCERAPYTLNFLLEETMAVYGLLESEVFKDFPDLKIVVSHGGGAIPYHVGRFRSSASRRGFEFLDSMRNLHYDTVLYSEEALRLLIKTVGADRCLFGAECPGVGSSINPDTGRTFDDIAPFIRGFDWLTDADREMIFEGNSRRLFKLLRAAH